MLKTYLYIPDELNKKIEQTSKLNGKSKAEVIRTALEEGLESKKLRNRELYLQKLLSMKGGWISEKEIKKNRADMEKRLKKLWNE